MSGMYLCSDLLVSPINCLSVPPAIIDSTSLPAPAKKPVSRTELHQEGCPRQEQDHYVVKSCPTNTGVRGSI